MSSATAKWCEACGHDLAAQPKPACVACGDAAVEADGFCHSCGHAQPRPRDHVELTAGPVAAVSDRGRRHHHNEDAVAIEYIDETTAVMVVCDGVSPTPGSAEVSAVAASATATALASAVASARADIDSPSADGAASDQMLLSAVEAARVEIEAAAAITAGDLDVMNPPSTTLVAAVVRRIDADVMVSVVWLGDSRAYWISGEVDGDGGRDADGDIATGAELLTADHEIAGALTRWIGVDAMDHVPETSHHRFPVAVDAELIVCSDGMWRYFDPERGEPAPALIARLKTDGLIGLDLVRAMVDFANEQGGHDNISVARWPAGPPETDPATTLDAAEAADETEQPPGETSDETEQSPNEASDETERPPNESSIDERPKEAMT